MDDGRVTVRCVAPYDFSVSVSAMRSREPGRPAPETPLRVPTMIDGTPVVITVSPDDSGSGLRAASRPESDPEQVRSLVEWVLFAALDLAPFYSLTGADSRLAPVVQKLYGLKPMRPASLFEMAVIAITEQQVSLASAYHVRDRLIRRYGTPVDDLWVFPGPETLAAATLADLRSVGLTRQKADYVQTLARHVASSDISMDGLKIMPDADAREAIMGWRGFGAWSAEYILVRGLARPDSVPPNDVGIRRVVGTYLGNGARSSSAEVEERLEPFRPYRGLLAFYLLVYGRLSPRRGARARVARE